VRYLLLSFALLSLSACCDVEGIPQRIRQLDSRVAKERNDAALALARCGEKADKAVSKLARLLYDENVGVQSAASYALRRIDTPAARQVLERVEATRRNR